MKKRLVKVIAVVLIFCFAVFPVSAFAIFPDPFGYRDVNGDGSLDVIDALVVLKACSGLITLTPEQIAIADVSQDGTLDILDALIFLKYVNNYHIL